MINGPVKAGCVTVVAKTKKWWRSLSLMEEVCSARCYLRNEIIFNIALVCRLPVYTVIIIL